MIITHDSDEYQKVMKWQRLQFAKWTAAGQPEGDLEMYGITKAVARLPGCVTRYGCESHPKRRRIDRFYLMVLADTVGYQHLINIHTRMFARWDGGWNDDALSLAAIKVALPTVDGFAKLQAFVFETRLIKASKRDFLWTFQNVITEYADELALPLYEETEHYRTAVHNRRSGGNAARLG